MKISFLIPAIVLNVVRVAFSNNVQVGTVLFTTTDLVKKCWTDYDKSLLRARAIMQDVLPDPDCLDFSNPEAIVILLDYFHACYQIISTSTYGRVQNLLFVTMSDAFGGYLRAHVLPYTRKSYYAGVVKYAEAKKLFVLYDDIKKFLKTDGVGWATPSRSGLQEFQVKPLQITGATPEACKELFIIETEGKPHYMDPAGESENRNAGNKEKWNDTVQYLGYMQIPKPMQYPSGFYDQFKPKKPSTKTSISSDCLATARREERQLNMYPYPFLYPYLYTYPNASQPSQAYFQNAAQRPDETQYAVYFRNQAPSPKSQEGGRPKEPAREGPRKEEPGKEGPREEGARTEESPKVQAPARIRTVIVPLPMLDDEETPSSIAVPLRKQPLQNLKSESSAFVLERYYTSVIKCFIAKGNTRNDIKNFNGQFHCWLTSKVLPHLEDEEWYPGFGGVLRVMETIKLLGLQNTYKGGECHDYGFLFDDRGERFPVDTAFSSNGRYNGVEDIADLEKVTNPLRRYLLTFILVSSLTIFFLLFCGLIYWITHARRRPPQEQHYHQEEQCGSNSNFLTRLFKSKPKDVQPVHQHEVDQDLHFHKACEAYPTPTEEEKKYLESVCQQAAKSDRCQGEEKHVAPATQTCCPHTEKPPPKDPPKKAVDSHCQQCVDYKKHPPGHQKGQGHARPKWGSRMGGDARGSRHHHETHFFTQHGRSPFEPPRRLHNVHTLWKKPSNLTNRYWTSGLQKMKENFTVSSTGSDGLGYNSATIEDETKYCSSEVRTTTCHCTESCHCTTLTDSSIFTKAQKRKSSTVTFFDRGDVHSRGNASTRSSTQYSTMESGSEDSYSSGYSMSSKSVRKYRNSKNYP